MDNLYSVGVVVVDERERSVRNNTQSKFDSNHLRVFTAFVESSLQKMCTYHIQHVRILLLPLLDDTNT